MWLTVKEAEATGSRAVLELLLATSLQGRVPKDFHRLKPWGSPMIFAHQSLVYCCSSLSEDEAMSPVALKSAAADGSATI